MYNDSEQGGAADRVYKDTYNKTTIEFITKHSIIKINTNDDIAITNIIKQHLQI